MAALTIAQKLAVAEICEYLVTIAIEKGGLFAGGIDLELPTKIYNIRNTIQYQYEQNPSDTSLVATTNYLYGMCLLNLQALAVTGVGGIVAAVVGGNYPSPYQFTVAASGSYMIDGQSSQTITSFIGYNLMFIRNNITQTTIDAGGGSSYYSWSKNTGGFVAVPALVTGEIIQLFPT